MQTKTFEKPSGQVIEINERAFAYAKSLGWKEVTKPKPGPKPKDDTE